jgi:biopolymer transport protein TolR
MPALASRGSGRGRRSLNEINMVPFIDVMLVLLIIFMVTAPLITTVVVDLPSVGKGNQRASKVVEIVIGTDEKLKLRQDAGEFEGIDFKQLTARVKALQGGNAELPVVISADKSVRYENVVRVMDTLQRAGVRRVGLSVKQGPPS